MNTKAEEDEDRYAAHRKAVVQKLRRRNLIEAAPPEKIPESKDSGHVAVSQSEPTVVREGVSSSERPTLESAKEIDTAYQRGYRDGYQRRDDEVQAALC